MFSVHYEFLPNSQYLSFTSTPSCKYLNVLFLLATLSNKWTILRRDYLDYKSNYLGRFYFVNVLGFILTGC